MEECAAVNEATNQQRAPPINPLPRDSSLDDYIKKIVDNLVSTPAPAPPPPPRADDAGARSATEDDAESSDNSVSADSEARPWSLRRRRRYQASLETIAETHDLRLAETTPSMIALTSQTSVASAASGQSVSVQTIFHTPDWVDDDSDNKLSERTDLPAKSGRMRGATEATTPTRGVVDGGVVAPAGDGRVVAADGNVDSAEQSPLAMLMENICLPAAKFQERCDELDLSHFDQLAPREPPVKEGTRPAIEDLEQTLREIREFDPLSLSDSHAQTDARIRDRADGGLTLGGFESPVLAPVVLMQFAVTQNHPGSLEFQQSAAAFEDGEDLIQFDNLSVSALVAEGSSHSTTEAPLVEEPFICSEVKTLDDVPTPFPTSSARSHDAEVTVVKESEPKAQTPAALKQLEAFKNSGLQEFRQNLNHLREMRDSSLIEATEAIVKVPEAAIEQPELPVAELEPASSDDIAPEPEASVSPPLEADDERDADGANGAQDRKRVNAETPLEQLQRPNELEADLQTDTSQSQESFHFMSFNHTEEMTKAGKGTRESSAIEASADISKDTDLRGQTITPTTGTSSTNTDCRQLVNTLEAERDAAPTHADAHADRDEFEVELTKTSSDIHQIRQSSSELLQDFYDMRRTYAAEFSQGSQSVARTVAERDRPPPAPVSLPDGQPLGSGTAPQCRRIGSAIDLMDATIDEIQKWQARKGTPPERDVGIQAAPVAVKREVDVKGTAATRNKPPEIIRSATVPSTPSLSRGRPPPNKPALGNPVKRDAKAARAETGRGVRPLTSHVPNRSQDAKGGARAPESASPPRRDVVVGDARSTYVAASRRVQPVRPSINIPASKLHRSPSARLGRSPATKSARAFRPQTPEEALDELKKCTQSPAAYLERCLAVTQVDAGRAKRLATQKEDARTAPTAKRAPTTADTPKKPGITVPPSIAAAAKESNTPKVHKPKENLFPKKLVEVSKKGSNAPEANENDVNDVAPKPKNRFLSDDDIEKWVRLSTRYARCAERGAELFTSGHSCDADKKAVTSDGAPVRTASDVLVDALMDTVTSAVARTSRARGKAGSPSKQPATEAAKAILSKLSDGDTRCITQLKTEEKVTRSIDNLVRSMSKIVDATSDSRVCWDSSLDSLPTTEAGRDAGLDDVQEEMVEKSRQVVEKMTETLIKHMANQPDELDFKVADDVEPPTCLSTSMEDVVERDLCRTRKAAASNESLKRWSDTKSNQLEVILSRLAQTNATASSWGLALLDADAVPASVKASRHKLATLENIVALLTGISHTCKKRENNVEWDEPVEPPPRPSMKPLPDRSARAQKARAQRTKPRDKTQKSVTSSANSSSKQASKGGTAKSERPSQSNASEAKPRLPVTPPKRDAGSPGADAPEVEVPRQGRPADRTSEHRRSVSGDLDASKEARLSYCDSCDEKRKEEKRAAERGETPQETLGRLSRATIQRRERSMSPLARSGSAQSSGSTQSRLSYCDTCDEKRKKAKRAEERGETHQETMGRLSRATIQRIERSLSPPVRSGSAQSSGSTHSKQSRLSYCDTCDEKRKKAKRAEERGEIPQETLGRLSRATIQRRERSMSPLARSGSAQSSGSTQSRLSYCDTCDAKRKKAKRAEERGENTAKASGRLSRATIARRERSLSPPPSRSGSAVSSGSSGSRHRFSYCDTCDAKRRKAALAKERGETEPRPARRSVSNTSGSGRSRRGSSASSNSSLEGGSSTRPRFSYCDTCDERLRNQTPPATPLKNAWRSDSSQDFDAATPRSRVSFSAPLEFFERRVEPRKADRREDVRHPAKAKLRRNPPSDRTWASPSSVLDLRKTDSLLSNLSASLSKDSASGNYSSATFIISDRPSRRSRVDLALPKIRHVEGTKSTYKHVLQKAFMDRLDNIIKVQSASSRVHLTPKPSASSSTSMARFTLKSGALSSADKYNMRHHIPTATELRARMKRCCDRMPSTDLFGVAISRESLARRASQPRFGSDQSLGQFLDDVRDVEEFAATRNKAFSTTYAAVIQRERPFQATTKISRKIQSFIRRDLSSWHKITSECIQSVRQDDSILPFTVAPAPAPKAVSVLPSNSSAISPLDESLLLALIAALGGSPRTNPTLLAGHAPASVAKEAVKAIRKNKKYRQRDNLEEDEVAIPIADICSSETLFKVINAVLKTDTEASLSPTESRSTEVESRSSTTDFEAECGASDSNVEHVIKPDTMPVYGPSQRNLEIDSTGSATDYENDGASTSRTQVHHVLENVARFSYSPAARDSSSALSSSDCEDAAASKATQDAESQDAEIVGAKAGGAGPKTATKSMDATSEGDMPAAEGAATEGERPTTSIDSARATTADSSLPAPAGSINSASALVHDQLFSCKTEESSESLQKVTNYDANAVKEGSVTAMKGDLKNSSRQDNNESCCSIPEMLERLEMAIPFQHERLAIETISGTSMPIVDAITEDTWEKLGHAISHLPQEPINTKDEVYSRHHNPSLPLEVRADLDIYNECQDDESLYQNQKTSNRCRNTRDGICGMRQTKSLLADNMHEARAKDEPRYWSGDADGCVAASGDTDANDPCSTSDGVSLIANVSTDVCVTDSVADASLLDVSASSTATLRSSASSSRESLASDGEYSLASRENEILASLLDQVNTRSQLEVLNARLDGVVRREQLVEEVMEPRVVEWRGTSTVSALCLTFGAVVAGAIMGIPRLWE